jgi:hypothetical protein
MTTAAVRPNRAVVYGVTAVSHAKTAGFIAAVTPLRFHPQHHTRHHECACLSTPFVIRMQPPATDGSVERCDIASVTSIGIYSVPD